jgi:acyl carrier protein
MTASNLNQELKELIVQSLQLEDIEPAAISDTDALFGTGLSLDAIDALELATAISRKYGIKVREDEEPRGAFRSVQHLADFITRKRAERG